MTSLMRYQPQEVILTEDELRKLCAEWQETLRLEDWDITVEIKPDRDLPGDCSASIDYHLWQRRAKIAIIRHEDYRNEFAPHDMEYSLVHEMVHLMWTDVTHGRDAADVAMERAVHSTAMALVALKRACEGDTTITVHDDAGFDVQSDDGTTGEVAVLKGRGPEGPIVEDRRREKAAE